MTKDSIKISQEINFNGMPTWVSVGASLLPDDNVLEGLKSLQQDITDYHQTASKEYSQSKWKVKSEPEYGTTKSMIEEMEACSTFDEINSFRFTVKNEEEKAVYERKLTELSPKK